MDWKGVVSSVAPWIGTALGGPLGSMAVTAVADALGLSDKTEAAIKQAMAGASPEDLYKLKMADQQFAVQMQQAGYQNTQALERIALDDRSNARNREVALADWTPRVLAALVTIGFFGAILLLALVPTTESREPLLVMVGSLGTAWTQIVSYYFGSTAGGQRKSDLLAKAGVNS